GDLLSLYVFWELMAVASTFIIISRNTEQAKASAFRYVLVHLLGGLLLLAGIIYTIQINGGDISFTKALFAEKHVGVWLIGLGILVNCGALPLGSWLPDSYPAASISGGLIMSAYTTKTSVYCLLRGFEGGWDFLIWVGCAMALYGVIMALMENNIRRMLAYIIVSQVGIMVVGAGIGTKDAINGAAAHAFCSVIYTSLQWMVAGAIIYRTGKTKFTDLGGLFKSMPITGTFAIISGLTIAAFPFTNGFVSKTIILYQADKSGYSLVWLILEVASVGAFLLAGLKFTYFLFFGKDSGHRPQEANTSMSVAMVAMAFLCVLIGCYPSLLYSQLPTMVKFEPYALSKVVHQLQLLLFTSLGFCLFLKFFRGSNGTPLDFDWFYRKGSPLIYKGLDKGLNGINATTKSLVVDKLIKAICHFFESAPSRLLCLAMVPYWKSKGCDEKAIEDKAQDLYRQGRRGAFAIGITAF
ncbi:MAG: proton-conducting transporter membrane subunit, partial [Verrucomicrobiota bacterium]